MELIEKIKIELKKGRQGVIAVLPCGGGKSIIQAEIAKKATEKNNNVLFIVHRQELLEQIKETFLKHGVDESNCEFYMVQTASKRLSKLKKPQLIITDEAHHSTSTSYKKIYERFTKSIRIGFTATPERLDKQGLEKIYQNIVESVNTRWLIQQGYLSPYKYYSVKLANTKGLHTVKGDYIRKEISELMEQKRIYGDTIKNYKNIADGQKTIVYCSSIKSSEETVKKFNEQGIKAKHIDAKTKKKEREKIVKEFRENKIKVLCNVDLFGEGFDVPDCECVILLRPTKSLSLFIQQSTRAMRYKEGKTATIIDHVGNVFIHGLPDSEREWKLEGKSQKCGNTIHIKQCDKCFYVVDSEDKMCPNCKVEFEKKERKEKSIYETKMEEITEKDIYMFKQWQEYRECKTFEELVKFQQGKKYQFNWVIHKCRELGIEIPSKYKNYARRVKRYNRA